MTDIPRLRKGGSAASSGRCSSPQFDGPVAVGMTMEQIDIARDMTARYPHVFEMAYTADDVVRAGAKPRRW